MIRSVLAFLGLVAACGALIAATAALTSERVKENRTRRFQHTLVELTGSARLAAATRFGDSDVALLCDGSGHGHSHRRALMRGTARGYGGDIRWLAAADLSGKQAVLDGVRIVAHQETPGIADFLDHPTRGWMASLNGANAAELAHVDGVSGATITSRALSRSLAAGLERPALACSP